MSRAMGEMSTPYGLIWMSAGCKQGIPNVQYLYTRKAGAVSE